MNIARVESAKKFLEGYVQKGEPSLKEAEPCKCSCQCNESLLILVMVSIAILIVIIILMIAFYCVRSKQVRMFLILQSDMALFCFLFFFEENFIAMFFKKNSVIPYAKYHGNRKQAYSQKCATRGK
jgi:hypothetical protein